MPVRVLNTSRSGILITGHTVRTIRELAIRRAQFKEFLSTNRNLSFSRYFRLMGLAGVQILFSIPLSIVTIYLNLTTTPLQPWESWDRAHANYSEIAQLSSSLWHDSTANIFNVELSRWSVVLCSFVFFAFFGFADEARRNYRLAYAYVTKRMGLSSGTWTANRYVKSNSDSRFSDARLTNMSFPTAPAQTRP